MLLLSEVIMENFKSTFKIALFKKDKTLSEVARALETKSQNLSNKLKRGSITYDEALKIADILGYQIQWIDKED